VGVRSASHLELFQLLGMSADHAAPASRTAPWYLGHFDACVEEQFLAVASADLYIWRRNRRLLWVDFLCPLSESATIRCAAICARNLSMSFKKASTPILIGGFVALNQDRMTHHLSVRFMARWDAILTGIIPCCFLMPFMESRLGGFWRAT